MITAKQLNELKKAIEADKTGRSFDIVDELLGSMMFGEMETSCILVGITADDVEMMEQAGFQVLVYEQGKDHLSSSYEIRW